MAVINSLQQLENILLNSLLSEACRSIFENLKQCLINKFENQVEFALSIRLN